jgi:hypothetical protein
MGWYFEYCSRRDLVRNLTSDNGHTKVVAHTLRGSHLWCVREITKVSETLAAAPLPVPVKVGDRFITLDLIAKGEDGTHGHKPMDEGMHPYYYTCPKSYLELATWNTCEPWREGVRQWHEQQKVKRARRAAIRKGQRAPYEALDRKLAEALDKTETLIDGLLNNFTQSVQNRAEVL